MVITEAILGAILAFSIIGVVDTFDHTRPTDTTISAPYTRPLVHTWTKTDSLAYAHDAVIKDAEAQFVCLSNLWGKESAWNPKAVNPVKVMGKNAGGIPQILNMSPLTPPTLQIERGLAYIAYRYYTPCKAWAHFQRHSWY